MRCICGDQRAGRHPALINSNLMGNELIVAAVKVQKLDPGGVSPPIIMFNCIWNKVLTALILQESIHIRGAAHVCTIYISLMQCWRDAGLQSL